MAHQVEGLISDARTWRAAARDRAPSYHRILETLEEVLEEHPEVRAKIEEAWGERAFSIFYERPLLLIAAMRFDALERRESHPLFGALRDRAPDATCVSKESLLAALDPMVVWSTIRERYVQTNETARAVAWLWPAGLAGGSERARPIALVELGCAAGLNLVADGMPAPWTDARGAKLPVVERPEIVARIGIDRRPVRLDATEERFLRACIWAGETERLERFDAAVAAFREAEPAPALEVLDLTEVGPRLRDVQAALPARGIAIAFQTIVRDYLDAEANATYEAAMRRWLESCPRGTAVWLELELAPDGEDPSRPAAIRAHLPDDEGQIVDLVLARTGYHPVEVAPDEAAVARFRELTLRSDPLSGSRPGA